MSRSTTATRRQPALPRAATTSRRTPAPVLPPAGRHLVTRFSYGLTPDLVAQVRRKGGAHAWLEWQLHPERIDDSAAIDVESWFPCLAFTPQQAWQHQVDMTQAGWEQMADYARHLLVRRMRTRRPVLELLTELWENHFNVPATGDAPFVHRVSYGATIRAHALGRFEDLLVAAVTHPAMLIYLDNAVSTKEAPNENLGRELLELHTVGIGHYTEDDVKASARILTGWWVDVWNTWAASYNPDAHATGPVTVMGFHAQNADPDGRAVTRRYLSYLAHHPATARRVATKLATHFVHDHPPRSLVDRLAQVYLANDTRIRPVLRALVDSPEFATSAGRKVRTPEADVVATYRALGAEIHRPVSDDDAAHVVIWQSQALGSTPFSWPRPDGQPLDDRSWSSPSRVLGSLSVHYTMCGGWWPTHGVTLRSYDSWLPADEVRFDHLVDHLSRVLLGRPATSRIQRACSQSVALDGSEPITADHPLVKWSMPRLLTTLLDSPAFLTR